MIIQVNEKMDIASPLPIASYSLQKCDGSRLFHETRAMRHPLASYNISIASISKRLSNVLDALDALKIDPSANTPFKPDWEHPLLEATDHLLDALMEHMEDCENILESFFENPNLKQNKKIISAYKKKVDPYRDHIGKIDNFIKHQQGRIRFVVFYNSEMAYPGYFVEGLVAPGVVGPSPVIHPNSDTAFSFSRDLRFHIANLYGVSKCLSDAIGSLGGFLNHPTTPSNAAPSSPTDPWISLLQRISAMTTVCFPDEVKKPFPSILVDDEDVAIKFPDNSITRHSFSDGIRITTSFVGDGVTKSFKMPYFNAGNA